MAGRRRIRIAPATLNNALSGQAVAGAVASGALSVGGGGSPLFFDGFDYEVPRDTPSPTSVFSSRGWAGTMKATNISDDVGDGRGYIYTTDATPTGIGRSGVFESHPELGPNVSGERQTDYYLIYGTASEGNRNRIPGNVWFTWWTYGVPGSRYFGSDKLFYPTFATTHETSTLLWMLLQGSIANATIGGHTAAPAGARRFGIVANDANNAAADVGAGFTVTRLWQNLDPSPCLEGIWYQVKFHFDTSGPQGTWEMWRRQYGLSEWTKCAEWIGGVTTMPHWNTGAPTLFNWIIGSNSPGVTPGGHTAMKMPTVVVCPDSDPYSSTTYMDDFGIYTSDPG